MQRLRWWWRRWPHAVADADANGRDAHADAHGESDADADAEDHAEDDGRRPGPSALQPGRGARGPQRRQRWRGRRGRRRRRANCGQEDLAGAIRGRIKQASAHQVKAATTTTTRQTTAAAATVASRRHRSFVVVSGEHDWRGGIGGQGRLQDA